MFLLWRRVHDERQKGRALSILAAYWPLKRLKRYFTQARSMTVPMEGFPTYGGLTAAIWKRLPAGCAKASTSSIWLIASARSNISADVLRRQESLSRRQRGGHGRLRRREEVAAAYSCGAIPGPGAGERAIIWKQGYAGRDRLFSAGRDAATGEQLESKLELLRLTIPRPSKRIIIWDVIADALIEIKDRASTLRDWSSRTNRRYAAFHCAPSTDQDRIPSR